MSDPDDCRESAKELRELADRTKDTTRRQRLHDLAAKLEGLAEEWEPGGRPRSGGDTNLKEHSAKRD